MLRRLPLHPPLLAAFPVLLLWSQNRSEVESASAALLVGKVVLVTAIATALLALVLRDARRGALVASTGAVLHLSFGYLYGAERAPAPGLALWALLLIAAGVAAIRQDDDALGRATLGSNIIGAALVIALLPTTFGAWSSPARPTSDGTIALAADGAPLRDIIYIVPDRYGREDNLTDTFGIDNSGFVDALEQRGFDVLDDTFGNYPRTSHSLAATLSMAYLDELADGVPDDRRSELTYVYPMLRDHRVGDVLVAAGYHYIHIGSWWSPTASADAAHEVRTLDRRSEFSQIFSETTAFAALQRARGIEGASFRDRVRASSVFQLDELDRIAEKPRALDEPPRFVMAHITLPHEPYVFDRDGSVVSVEEESSRERPENYERQLTYLNERLLTLVDELLAGPDETDPIIIIQADEGPHTRGQEVTLGSAFRFEDATTAELRTKLRVFSALHLPGVAEGDLPGEGMSSVNTFRYVLDTYLGTDLGLLEDHAYIYPDNDDYYTFTDVTDLVR